MTTTLAIVTTKQNFLPGATGEQLNGIFHDAGACLEVETPNLSAFFDKKNEEKKLSKGHIAQIWQLKDEEQAVFGARCLPDLTNLEGEAINEFVKSLFSDVAQSLSKEERDSIQQIIFFGHSDDLAYSGVKIAPLPQHSLLTESSWLGGKEALALFPDKKIIVGKGEEQGGVDSIAVYFTAFSHEDQPFYRLLQFGERLLDKGQPLAQELEMQAKLLLGWSMEKKWIEDAKPTEGNPDQFKIRDDLPYQFHLYYAGEEGLEKQAPTEFAYKNDEGDLANAILDKSMPASDRQVNLVFLPLVAVAEFSDRSFYEKVIAELHPENQEHPCPTLFVSFRDIMAQPDGERELPSAPFELDRRHKFLDSSIWYRYVPIQGGFEEKLKNALQTIGWAYDNRLYYKNVCREFLEFQNRLVRNSYLENKYGSGHAMRVFPFTFHSESAMTTKAQKTKAGLDDSKLDWNFLLVDDYAKHRLREGKGEGEGSTKGEIIEQLMESWPVGSKRLTKFDTCASVAEARKALGCTIGIDMEPDSKTPPKVIYDIVLLDYLFSHPDVRPQHYGTELLDSIRNAESHTGLGVLQSYWIYPISVFNEAIQSHLQEKGYQHMEEYWQLARGADPLNTPHLFRRTLFKFMQAQARKIQFEQREIWMFLADHAQTLFIKEESKQNKQLGVSKQMLDRSKAMQAFRKFIERFSMDEGLPDNSALAKAVRTQLDSTETRDLRDHLRQLLYLLGFSVGFDFPIIKQELDHVEAYHLKINKKDFPTQLDAVNEGMKNLSLAVYSISGKYF